MTGWQVTRDILCALETILWYQKAIEQKTHQISIYGRFPPHTTCRPHVLPETGLLLIKLLYLQLLLVLGLHILVLDLVDILGSGSRSGCSTNISTGVVNSDKATSDSRSVTTRAITSGISLTLIF